MIDAGAETKRRAYVNMFCCQIVRMLTRCYRNRQNIWWWQEIWVPHNSNIMKRGWSQLIWHRVGPKQSKSIEPILPVEWLQSEEKKIRVNFIIYWQIHSPTSICTVNQCREKGRLTFISISYQDFKRTHEFFKLNYYIFFGSRL